MPGAQLYFSKCVYCHRISRTKKLRTVCSRPECQKRSRVMRDSLRPKVKGRR